MSADEPGLVIAKYLAGESVDDDEPWESLSWEVAVWLRRKGDAIVAALTAAGYRIVQDRDGR